MQLAYLVEAIALSGEPPSTMIAVTKNLSATALSAITQSSTPLVPVDLPSPYTRLPRTSTLLGEMRAVPHPIRNIQATTRECTRRCSHVHHRGDHYHGDRIQPHRLIAKKAQTEPRFELTTSTFTVDQGTLKFVKVEGSSLVDVVLAGPTTAVEIASIDNNQFNPIFSPFGAAADALDPAYRPSQMATPNSIFLKHPLTSLTKGQTVTLGITQKTPLMDHYL